MIAEKSGLLELLRAQEGSGNGYANMQRLLDQPTAQETTAQGIQDAVQDIPTNTFAGGLVKGLGTGYGIAQKSQAASKKDRMTEYLMAQQQYQMEVAKQQEEMLADLAKKKAAFESKQLIQSNIDLSLDAYQSTGSLAMLNETLSNEAAAPFRKLFEEQVAAQGGAYQGVTATPEGDLMPYGVTQDGKRVYGQPIPVSQGYSQGYLTAKQAKELDAQKAQAELQKTQAGTLKDLADAGYAPAANGGNGGAVVGAGTPMTQTQPAQQAAPAPQQPGTVAGLVSGMALQQAPKKVAEKPLPASMQKLIDEKKTVLTQAAGTNADLQALVNLVDQGKLTTDPFSRATGWLANATGNSTENSRNLATLESKLNNARNAILLLNKGVQTDGDAQRAMDEIIAGAAKNDTQLVRQRLSDLIGLNQRAIELQGNQVNDILKEYGRAPADLGVYSKQPAAVNLRGQQPSVGVSSTVGGTMPQQSAPVTKVLNGVTYIKQNGQWFQQ